MACGNLSQANMTVTTIDGETEMRLHGNLIARSFTVPGGFGVADSRRIEIRDAGWTSNTTKERLNGLLQAFAPGWGIWQRDFEWFIGRHQTGGDPGPTHEWTGHAIFSTTGDLLDT